MLQNPERYVIQVISGTEESVKKSLFQRRENFGMENYILDVYIPSHDVVSIKSGGEKIKKQKNLLPGYILVQMKVTNESWFIVRNTPNVTGFLGAGNVPVPVSQEELEKLKGKASEKSESFETKYKIGDQAIVTKGAFEGNIGMITDINTKKGTLKLNINLLGRDTPISLEYSDIKLK